MVADLWPISTSADGPTIVKGGCKTSPGLLAGGDGGLGGPLTKTQEAAKKRLLVEIVKEQPIDPGVWWQPFTDISIWVIVKEISSTATVVEE